MLKLGKYQQQLFTFVIIITFTTIIITSKSQRAQESAASN